MLSELRFVKGTERGQAPSSGTVTGHQGDFPPRLRAPSAGAPWGADPSLSPARSTGPALLSPLACHAGAWLAPKRVFCEEIIVISCLPTGRLRAMWSSRSDTRAEKPAPGAGGHLSALPEAAPGCFLSRRTMDSTARYPGASLPHHLFPDTRH